MKVGPWYMRYRDATGEGGDDGGGGDGDAGAGEGVSKAAAAVAGTDSSAAAVGAATGKDVDKGAWPDDWRSLISPDKQHEKTLSRFASPQAMFDSYMSLRQKLDSGEIKAATPFPAKGKPEEQATWRKEHGIPEKPDDYSLAFKDGLVFGDEDKPFVDEFLAAAHQSNTPPEAVNSILHWYNDTREKAMQKQAESDSELLHETEDALRSEWGGEYRSNINILSGLISTMPEESRDLFVGARLADGRALMNVPTIARWLLGVSRELNPMHTVVPGAGANMASAIEDEIAGIEKLMRTNRLEYNRDEKKQARYRELLGARERLKK